MSVLLCIPTYETVAVETFKSVYGLTPDPVQGRPLFDYVKGYGIAQARNKCAKEALDYGFDYLMFVDSDIILPQDALINMLHPEADVVLGMYPRRGSDPLVTEIFKDTCFDFTDNYTVEEYKSLPDARVDIKGGGLGCSLIRTEVFKSLPYPWFDYVEYENGSTLSEDNFFCNNASKAGFTIQADTRVQCPHKNIMWLV